MTNTNTYKKETATVTVDYDWLALALTSYAYSMGSLERGQVFLIDGLNPTEKGIVFDVTISTEGTVH